MVRLLLPAFAGAGAVVVVVVAGVGAVVVVGNAIDDRNVEMGLAYRLGSFVTVRYASRWVLLL